MDFTPILSNVWTKVREIWDSVGTHRAFQRPCSIVYGIFRSVDIRHYR